MVRSPRAITAKGPSILTTPWLVLVLLSACSRRTVDAVDGGGTGSTAGGDPSSSSASATGQDGALDDSTTGEPVPRCVGAGGELRPLPGHRGALGWILLPGGDPERSEALVAVAYAPVEDAFYAVGSRTMPRPGDNGDSLRISVESDGTIRCVATAGPSDVEGWNRDHDIAVLPSGELVIASERNVRPLVARTDPEWQVLAEEQYLIEPGLDGDARYVAVSDDGATRVVGTQSFLGPFFYDRWGREYAPSEPPANEVWQAEADPRASDFYGPVVWSTAAHQWFIVQRVFEPLHWTRLVAFDPGATQPTLDALVTSELDLFDISEMVATSSAVVVCGDGKNVGDDHRRAWIAAYSFDGVQEWSIFVDGAEGRSAYCHGIARDEHEDLVVVGKEYGVIDGEHVSVGTIRKLDPSGMERWHETVEPEGYTTTILNDVAIGANGQIVAVGTVRMGSSSDPIIVSVAP
jgi:hypothetical protein